MSAETQEFIKYILRFGAIFFFLGALALDLAFLFHFSHRETRSDFPGIADLRRRVITFPAVVLTLFTALIFTLPGQLGQSASEAKPTIAGLVSGSLIYLFAAFLLLAFASRHARISVCDLFHSSSSSLAGAARKGVVYGIAAIPPTVIITVITNQLIAEAGYLSESQPIIRWLTDPQTPLLARMAIFASALIVAPLAEELIFRGILFPAVLKRRSWFFAATLTGCVFSLVHFHPPSFLSIFVLSLFFCAGYSVTGSLVTPIVMHMVFNACATLFTLLV